MAFKQKVVSEVESGKKSIGEVRREYGINGKMTIQRWINKFGKNHLLHRVVRIEMKDETSRIEELERDKRELESALAHSHLKILALESLVEIAKEKYNIDLKKKSGSAELRKQKKK